MLVDDSLLNVDVLEEQDISDPLQPQVSPKNLSATNIPKPNLAMTSEQEHYPYEDVLKAATEYFKGDELSATTWINKYALKDSHGKIYERTPEDMHRRLAHELARIENNYREPMSEDEIFGLLDKFKFLVPQGGPMTGIGNKYQVSSLSNCFVIGNYPAADSYGGIIRLDEEQVQLMKRRGGVGHDLSHIRPKGTPVMNSALNSTGIVPFMDRYSNSTREVAMDGRRGALMLSISIKHPDAEQFIDAKLDTQKVTGANVSVKIDHEFMRCVIEGKPYQQQYPINSSQPAVVKQVDARKLWKKIVHNAWASGEPGVLFWDTIINESVADCYADQGFQTVSTNPCGEIPLCPYDSCRLLSINLYGYVDKAFTSKATFKTELFKEHVHKAMRLMDDIIDIELEKIDSIIAKINGDPEAEDIKSVERNLWMKIKNKALMGRRTGLGITAEGDMLAALNLCYGTEEAIDFSVKVHKTLATEAYRASVMLAKQRGAFPMYDTSKEKENPFIRRIKESDPVIYDDMLKYGRRNVSMLTIAPAGTTSMMTQTTSGIEPVYNVVYTRRRKINPNDQNTKKNIFKDKNGDLYEEYTVFHHKFMVWLEKNGYNLDEIKERSIEFLNELVKKSPYHEASSRDVNWVNKVKMQGAVQKWVDHSISATVNVPKETTEELIQQIYQTAWESGCKGITVYRDGSRDGILVSKEKEKESVKELPKKRPMILEADVIRFRNQNEDWITFVGLYDGKPYEIFTGLSNDDTLLLPKSVTKGAIVKIAQEDGHNHYDFKYKDRNGYDNTVGGISHLFNKEFWNYAKMISGFLRLGTPIIEVIPIIEGLHLDNDSINTWKNGVVRSLKRYIPDGTKKAGAVCPECKVENGLQYKEGCVTCIHCGYSRCG